MDLHLHLDSKMKHLLLPVPEKQKPSMRSPLQKASVKRTIATITEKIDPLLEEGSRYFSQSIRTSYGLSGGGIYRLVDDEPYRELLIEESLRKELKFGSRIFDVVKKFPVFTKVKFQFVKGEPAEVKAYSVQMLLNDIAELFKGLLENKNASQAICQVEFFDNGELELTLEGKVITPSGALEMAFFELKDDAKCLYQALGREVHRLRFVFENGALHTRADRAFPEFEIAAFQNNSRVGDSKHNGVTALFEYLESGEEEKMQLALSMLQNNPSFRPKAESRYLALLRARSHNPFIGIDAAPNFMLNKVEAKLLQEKVIHPNHLNLAYLNRHESKVVVDFVGSILGNCLDVEDFKQEARQTKSESSLQQLIGRYYEIVKSSLQQAIEEYPEGWMSNVYQRLLDGQLEKVFFENTLFLDANHSLALEGFYLFLGMNSQQPIYIDIHQSEAPQIPEVIWMFKHKPQFNWSQTPANMPTSPLKFSR